MFFHIDIKGDGLPPKTVCLTYDDGPGHTTGPGPGPRTEELGEYLFARGIPATFFVIGSRAEHHLQTLDRLRAWGHLIGNHTYTHPGLVSLARSGGDLVGEIARTDEVISPYVSSEVKFLRAPYGSWRETDEPDGHRDKPTSIVASSLNQSGRLREYVGPINWDISGQDYDFWRRGRPAADCARRYLERIREVGRGIILMHDGSVEEETRAGNWTYQATRRIVPVLERAGYRFVRLDSIPQVRSAMRVSSLVALRSARDRFLAWSDAPGRRIVAARRSLGAREQFGVVDLGAGRIALRAGNGFFLAARSADSGEIRAAAPTLDEATVFHRDELGDDRITLGAEGRYLTCGSGGAVRWLPDTKRRRDDRILTVRYLHLFE